MKGNFFNSRIFSAEPLIEEFLAEVVKISCLNFEKMDFEEMDLNFKKISRNWMEPKMHEVFGSINP